jgi:hypothetical protein
MPLLSALYRFGMGLALDFLKKQRVASLPQAYLNAFVIMVSEE